MQPCRKGYGVLVDGKVNMSRKWALAVKSADHIMAGIKHIIAKWTKIVIVLLDSALV